MGYDANYDLKKKTYVILNGLIENYEKNKT